MPLQDTDTKLREFISKNVGEWKWSNINRAIFFGRCRLQLNNPEEPLCMRIIFGTFYNFSEWYYICIDCLDLFDNKLSLRNHLCHLCRPYYLG